MGRYRPRASGNVSDENGNTRLDIIDIFTERKKYHITIAEVKQAIKLMKNGKAIGPD